MVIGNPGTGKTSVAHIIAAIMHKCGVVDEERLGIVQRDELAGLHVGKTAAKTENVIRERYGGTLMIDEACRFMWRCKTCLLKGGPGR